MSNYIIFLILIFYFLPMFICFVFSIKEYEEWKHNFLFGKNFSEVIVDYLLAIIPILNIDLVFVLLSRR